MLKEAIPLTKNVQIKHGSHILYFFEDENLYLENAVSFILTAKQLHHNVVFIETDDIFAKVMNLLTEHLTYEDISGFVQFVPQEEFYETFGDFHFHRIIHNFKSVVQPYVESEKIVRVWGHVEWTDQADILKKLHTYERHCDLTVSELGFITVCTYNGVQVPSNILIEMLKSHEYFMTDKELVRSNLYKHSDQVVFPSLSVQQKIENEVDLFKQKLDFVHVVSHEVRNPLTVIKSYASIMAKQTKEPELKEKLQIIEDYAIAIDYELHHIIETEQMLATEVLWKTKLINALTGISEVLSLLEVKARTQNIQLIKDIRIGHTIIIQANLMGFKLIISNLLSNAIKYSNEGQQIWFRTFTEGQHLVIEVEDEGIGMSAEQMNTLFKKYERAHDSGDGQGIGLFMVHKLVEHFNGKINFISELNKGTFVQIKFPL